MSSFLKWYALLLAFCYGQGEGIAASDAKKAQSPLVEKAQGPKNSVSPKGEASGNQANPQKKDDKVQETPDEIDDPLEDWNRSVFAFNQMLNAIFWDPLSSVYEVIVPDFMQKCVRNLLSHASLPLSLVNDVFQFDGNKFSTHFVRLLINTSFGLGGLVDVCEMMGVTQEREDFGKTLKSVGVGPGVFVMLPILGPSNTRDSIGRLSDVLIQFPVVYSSSIMIPQYSAEYMNAYLDYKGSLTQVHESFNDPYAIVRSLYYQIRGDIDADAFGSGVEDDEDDETAAEDEKKEAQETKEDPAKKILKESALLKEDSLWDGVDMTSDFADEEENVLSSLEETEKGARKDLSEEEVAVPVKEESNL